MLRVFAEPLAHAGRHVVSIQDRCLERLSDDDRDRGRILLLFTLVYAASLLGSGVLYLALDLPPLAFGLIACGVLIVFAPLLMVRTGRVNPSNHLLAATALSATAFVCFFTGGIESPAIYWLVAAPGLSALVFDRPAGVAWSLVGLAFAVAMLPLTQLGFVSDALGPQASQLVHLSSITGLLIICSLIAQSHVALAHRALAHERARAEALVQARQTAEAASRAQNRFLARVSDGMRAPMNDILGTVQRLRQTNLDAKQTDIANTVHASSDALLHILSDILDLSKIDAGCLELAPTAFNLDALVDGLQKELSAAASAKRIEVRLAYDLDAGYWTEADPIRLRQLLTHLTRNAIQFTDRGWVQLSVRPRGDDRVLFEVRDTGIGIASDRQADLFDPLLHVDVPTPQRPGGIGLGLGLSQRLVRAMGGELRFRSRAGRGSTFWFDIPLPRTLPRPETDHTASVEDAFSTAVTRDLRPPVAAPARGATVLCRIKPVSSADIPPLG